MTPIIGPAGPVCGWTLLNAKREFTERHFADLADRFLTVINDHPALRTLPSRDRANAANCAARHALLAVRSGSIVEGQP